MESSEPYCMIGGSGQDRHNEHLQETGLHG